MTDNNFQNTSQYSGGFAFGGNVQPSPPTSPTPPPPQAPPNPPNPPAHPSPQNPPSPPVPPAPPVEGLPSDMPASKDDGYIFASRMVNFTTTVKFPANNLNFDTNYFMNLLAGSISLTKDEKRKIIDSMSKLRQEQVDELIRIFEEERSKFIELSPKHGTQLKKLEDEHMADWKDIEIAYVQEAKAQEEADQAEAIRKQLGI